MVFNHFSASEHALRLATDIYKYFGANKLSLRKAPYEIIISIVLPHKNSISKTL